MSRPSKSILWVLSGVIGLFLAGEIFVRWMFRLDCYPLYAVHPTIEYLLQPSQHIVCNGKTFKTNRWSMRSPDFDRNKSREEIRVMVFGDSIVHGFPLDQHELATSLLTKDLEQTMRRHVVVGNISAGSWGIPNYLAYEQANGFFDADVVVLVFSSHDLYDVPTFEPLSPIYQPQTRFHIVSPFGVQKLFGWVKHNSLLLAQGTTDKNLEHLKAICLKALDDLYQDLQKQAIPLLLVFHYEQDELQAEMINEFLDWARVKGVSVVSDREVLIGALKVGKNPYQDFIHLNALGQSLLEAVILDGLCEMGFIHPAAQAPVESKGASSESSMPQ